MLQHNVTAPADMSPILAGLPPRHFPHIRCEDDGDVSKLCKTKHGACTGHGACGLDWGHGGDCRCNYCGASY